MSRWETRRKPWDRTPGWRSETPDEQKGSRGHAAHHWPCAHLASRQGPRRSFPSEPMGMRRTSSVRSGPLMRADHRGVFMGMPISLAAVSWSVERCHRRKTETAAPVAALIPIARLLTVFRDARHSRYGSGGPWPAPQAYCWRAFSVQCSSHMFFSHRGMASGPFGRCCLGSGRGNFPLETLTAERHGIWNGNFLQERSGFYATIDSTHQEETGLDRSQPQGVCLLET
jgi:hypothetical protein